MQMSYNILPFYLTQTFYSVDNEDYIAYWVANMKYNVRRLSKLLSRGEIGKVILPNATQGQNNFQKLLRYNSNKVNAILKNTMNTTFNELANTAKNYPKQFATNLVCFVPNTLRLLRTKQQAQDRHRSRKYVRSLLREPGNVSIYINVILVQIFPIFFKSF